MPVQDATRVLLVEDNAPLRNAVHRYLTDAGYRVDDVEDGDAALKLLANRSYDLLITDIIMPGREGLETIRELRRRGHRLPVLAVSGGGVGSADNYLAVAGDFGASRVLPKPFALSQLLEVIRSMLDAEP